MDDTNSAAFAVTPEPQYADPTEAFHRAQAAERAGRIPEAEQIYRSLLRAYPKHPAVLHNLSLLVHGRGQAAEALQLMERAVDSTLNEPFLHNSHGGMLRAAGRYDDAAAAYQQAIALKPDYVDAHYNLGLVHEERGDYDAALLCHRDAQRVAPDFAPAIVREAALLNTSGRYDEALARADLAVTVAQELFDAQYYRGWILSNLRRYDEALEALARASTLRPDSHEALLATANALRDAGRSDQALAAYWQLLERRPQRLETHAELNQLAWTSGRHDLFLKSFGYARERGIDDADLLQLEAGFRLRRDDAAAAESLLREADVLAPQRGDITGLLARAVAAQGRFEESYPLFFTAIGIEPNEMRHRQEFAFALLRDGRPRDALRLIEQARLAAPFDQLLLAALAATYRELGDPRYATLMDYEKFVRHYDIEAPAGFGTVEEFNKALAQELDGLHKARREPIDQSLRGGTQTTGRLFVEPSPQVAQLRAAIDAAVSHYIANLPDEPTHPMIQQRREAFGYSGSWSCRLARGGHHGNHVHPQGWISSAYYVRLPSLGDEGGGREGWLTFGQSNLGLGERDRPECFVKPAVGRLVLFPSFFWHGTVPFDDPADRLSVAFDVLPV